jgi:hypothetical protein
MKNIGHPVSAAYFTEEIWTFRQAVQVTLLSCKWMSWVSEAGWTEGRNRNADANRPNYMMLVLSDWVLKADVTVHNFPSAASKHGPSFNSPTLRHQWKSGPSATADLAPCWYALTAMRTRSWALSDSTNMWVICCFLRRSRVSLLSCPAAQQLYHTETLRKLNTLWQLPCSRTQ